MQLSVLKISLSSFYFVFLEATYSILQLDCKPWPSRRIILHSLLNNNKLSSVSWHISAVSWIFKKPVPMHWASLDSLWHKTWLQGFFPIWSSISESITNGTFVNLTLVSVKSSSLQRKHYSQNWQNTIFPTF